MIERIKKLKIFLEKNEKLDTYELLDEYFKLVPFRGRERKESNLTFLMRVSGLEISYESDYALLIDKLITKNITGKHNTNYYKRIRDDYKKTKEIDYIIYSEEELRGYLGKFGVGKIYSEEVQKDIVDRAINYMKRLNMLFNSNTYKALVDTLKKEHEESL